MTPFRAAAAILAAAAVAFACAAASAAAPSRAELEAANERLVRAFLAKASPRLDHLREFLADDVTFQYEANRIQGRDALIARTAQQMAMVDRYGMEPVRIAVVGNTVLNDRVDVATLKDGSPVRLKVTSVFLIRDGKIAEWREYPQPEVD